MSPPRAVVPATRLISLFLDMQSAERGAADNTRQAYQRDLVDYAEFLGGRGRGPLDADTDDVRAYLADIEARGFSAATAARRLSSIRQFHKFLYLENRRGDDPALVIEGPRQGRRPRPSPSTMSGACSPSPPRGSTTRRVRPASACARRG